MRVNAYNLLAVGLVGAVLWAANDARGAPGAAALPGVPQVAVDAYAAAAASVPAECGLPWSLVAGIGAVESGHGTFGDSEPDPVTGVVSPPIRGPRLDGGAFARIGDTDDGLLDGDTEYDRAVGPMQFIPGTWRVYAPSADADPQNIKDAAKATARLLCAVSEKEGRPLTDPDVEEAAIRAYNNDAAYVDAVRAFAGDFARVAVGPSPGGQVNAETIGKRLGSEGRARWEVLGRRISSAPGTQLDRVYGVFDPLAGVLWSTLGSDSATTAAAVNTTDDAMSDAVGGNSTITVHTSIAGQVAHLLHDANEAGLPLKGSGYRTSGQQAELRRQHCPDPENSDPGDCSPPTARVGTSNHEKGLAIDFTNNAGVSLTRSMPEFAWLQANAARYGLHNLIGGEEPWHFSVDGR